MCYLKRKSLKDSIKILGAIVQECAKLGGPLTDQLFQLFLKKDYIGIARFEFHYELPYTTDDFIYARQIQALFSKQDFLDFGIDTEQVAFDKFIASEIKCRETNRRFRINAPGKPGVYEVLHLARRKIADILRDVPDLSDLTFKFGPGTNTSTKVNETNPRIKLSSSLECCANFAPFARAFLEEFPLWNLATSEQEVKISNGRLTFVPKTSLTKRTINIEPILTGLFQKGVGSYLKSLLKFEGLDLSDQEPNRYAAYLGSKNGEIATLDLSAASDTISYGLVLDLLPPEWFQFLEIARTSVTEYGDVELQLQKFSSMGNAYTFELESLIFYSLAHSVCTFLSLDTKYVRSFGDDIIVPTPAVALLVDVLNFCGFTVNTEKSFSEGRFRESCGADYLDGIDIRPFYLKEQINERILYLMHNWFVRNLEFKLAEVVLSFVNMDMILWGPDGYGDGHLVGEFSLRTSRKLQRSGFGGGVFDTYTLKKRFNKRLFKNDWVFPSYSIYVRHDVKSGDERDSYLDRTFPIESVATDPDVVRGSRGYAKMSIYTLASSIFGRYKSQD